MNGAIGTQKKTPVRFVLTVLIDSFIFFIAQNFLSFGSGIPGSDISFGISLLAAFAVVNGPVTGFLIGLLGQLLVGFVSKEILWGRVIGAASFGLIMGFASQKIDLTDYDYGAKDTAFFSLYQIIGNLISYLLVPFVIDYLIYRERVDIVVVRGVSTVIINIIMVAVFGRINLKIYTSNRKSAAKRQAKKLAG